MVKKTQKACGTHDAEATEDQTMPSRNSRPPEGPAPYSRLNKSGTGSPASTDDFGRPAPPKATRSQTAIEYVLFAFFGILIVLAGVALYTSNSPKNKIVPNYVAEGLKDDRVNVLFIGVGGPDHPSHDDLADSIMLVSLKPSTKQVAITSIPRDLWVAIPGHGTHRINYAHSIGDDSGYPGEGPGLLTATVSQIFGQKIHGFVRVDFSAFEKVIDDLGGIDVTVKRSFYDFLFKDGFVQGPHHLDGKRALAYARYRYVLGPEGNNFAREMRQQQVITALREKMQRRGVTEIVRLIPALSTMSSATETNLTTAQMASLYRQFHDVPKASIRNVSLRPLTEIFPVTRIGEIGDGVRPRTGDYREFQALERSIFAPGPGAATSGQGGAVPASSPAAALTAPRT